MNRLSNASRIYLAITAVTGIIALSGQLYLVIINRGEATIPVVLIRYISFFTILTNILITVCSIILLLIPNSPSGLFFRQSTTLTALTLYILIVGLTYNLILRPIWNPQGFQKVTDELLHVVMPLLTIIYWLIFVPKRSLTWNIWPWLIYPLIYAVYVLGRGALSAEYPYPFMDVTKLGYPQVLINCGGMVAAFLVFAFLLVGVGKILKTK